MDELKELGDRVVRAFKAWGQFGILTLQMTFVIPILVAFVLVVVLLPFAYAAFATQQHILLAVYMLAVLCGCAAYSLHKYRNRDEDDDPNWYRGRRVMSEERAKRRASSRLRIYRRSDRERH